jgi:hypothetical protein
VRADDGAPLPREPVYLALGADGAYTTGVLAQFYSGALHVLADWALAGHPQDALKDILRSAAAFSAAPLALVAGIAHFDRYHNHGLVQAAARLGVHVRPGGKVEDGREYLASLFRVRNRGLPAVLVSSRARTTLNGFAGGFSRKVDTAGRLAAEPETGVYRVALEGLEAFVTSLRVQVDSGREDLRYGTSADGRRYVTALPRRIR